MALNFNAENNRLSRLPKYNFPEEIGGIGHTETADAFFNAIWNRDYRKVDEMLQESPWLGKLTRNRVDRGMGHAYSTEGENALAFAVRYWGGSYLETHPIATDDPAKMEALVKTVEVLVKHGVDESATTHEVRLGAINKSTSFTGPTPLEFAEKMKTWGKEHTNSLVVSTAERITLVLKEAELQRRIARMEERASGPVGAITGMFTRGRRRDAQISLIGARTELNGVRISGIRAELNAAKGPVQRWQPAAV